MQKLVSLVCPCFNEADNIEPFIFEADRVFNIIRDQYPSLEWDFEIVFVDDGSSDGSFNKLKEASRKFNKNLSIQYISFSRNFGKEAALLAGLQKARGDFVCTLDVDLQHPPELIISMLQILMDEKVDSVAAKRAERKKGVRDLFSKLYYKIMNGFSETRIPVDATDYRMMTRKMLDAVLSLTEHNRFTKLIYSWVGFKTEWIEFIVPERIAGESKWNFSSLFRYAINGIINFSTKPLHFSFIVGFFMFLIFIILTIFIVVKTLVFGEVVSGFPTLACLILLIGALQFVLIGIIGEYVGKTYTEVKGRPHYIVAETSEDE